MAYPIEGGKPEQSRVHAKQQGKMKGSPSVELLSRVPVP